MNPENPTYDRFIPISDCELCSRLGDLETSFSRCGHEDEATAMPPEAYRMVELKPVKLNEIPTRIRGTYTFKRCPVCGTFYRYKSTYEYLVYGSEDEEEQVRCPAVFALRFLTDAQYDEFMEWMRAGLSHPNALTRNYAGKCLIAHHLERHEMDEVVGYLAHADPDVLMGAFFWVTHLVFEHTQMKEFWEIRTTFEKLANHPESRVANSARWVTEALIRYARYHKLIDAKPV